MLLSNLNRNFEVPLKSFITSTNLPSRHLKYICIQS